MVNDEFYIECVDTELVGGGYILAELTPDELKKLRPGDLIWFGHGNYFIEVGQNSKLV